MTTEFLHSIRTELHQRFSDISYTSGGLTAGVGVWTWLEQNATAISALCMIIGAIVCVLTWATNIYFKRKYVELERRKRNFLIGEKHE